MFGRQHYLRAAPETSELATGPALGTAVPVRVISGVPDGNERPGTTTKRARRLSFLKPRLLIACGDVFIIGFSELLADRIVDAPRTLPSGSPVRADLAFGAILVTASVIAFWINGLYRGRSRQLMLNTFSEIRDVAFALAVAGCVVLGINHLSGYIAVRTTFSSLTVVVTLAFAACLVPLERGAMRYLIRASALEHYKVLIVGSGRMAEHLKRYLSWDKQLTVVGCVDDEPKPGTAVLGPLSSLSEICRTHGVDQVIVSFSRTHPEDAIERLRALNPHVAVSVVPRYFELLSWRSSVNEIAGLAVIDVPSPALTKGSQFAKRMFDVVVSSLTIAAFAPLLIGIAIAVKVTSPGPVFFRQTRAGKDGKTFRLFKFRTMVVDAEARRHDAELGAGNIMDGPLFKLTFDPRVTKVGHFLRRYSLDEFPQLFNVLSGSMSLVGPRPFVLEEAAQIEGSAARRFDVKPGMTGLWQISGRNHLSYDELQRLDYLYVASWSILWDLKILWHTPSKVLRGHGAF